MAVCMADELSSLPLILTKHHRPPIPRVFVPRLRLLERLNRRLQRPLTLISAPAGYGKSTIVSSWLEGCPYQSAWLSLDENDNDLRTFVGYLMAAVRNLHPEVSDEIQSMLDATTLPSPKFIAHSLLNELGQIDQGFILVMDDYHLIHEKAVNDFIIEMLKHPSQILHLVLVTRVDPHLPLTSLRAKGQMTEIRIPDLRFSREETGLFLEQVMGTPVEDIATTSLDKKTEGWVTGLRLAVLSLRHRSDLDHMVANLPVESRYVTGYLLDEVLLNQPEEIQEYLLATAILDRFCASLCDAVCVPGSRSLECKMGGHHFLKWLETSDLFVVPLDEQGRWFRYHHLFQQLLLSRLKHRVNRGDILELYRLSSRWFAENKLIDEALQYALAAGDVSAAAQLVEQNRHAPLNKDRWFTLEKWLSKLPDDIVQQRPELLIAKAWVFYFRFELWAIFPMIEAIEMLTSDTDKELLRGEIDLFNGILLYWEGQGKQSLEILGRALEHIPAANIGIRNEAEIYFALCSQIAGQGKTAVQMYRRKFYNVTSEGTQKIRLLASIVFIHLLSGELDKADEAARQMNAMATKAGNKFIDTWASYLQGIIHFHWNNLEAASHHFSLALKNRFVLDAYADIDSYAGLIYSYQAMQQLNKANETMNQLMEFAQESGNPVGLGRAHSTQARLWLLQGDLEASVRWLKTADFSFDTGTVVFWLEIPRITRCRVLVAQGSETALREAKEELQNHWQLSHSTHNTFQMIEILLLQTLACLKQGQTDEALALLEHAVTLARPGGYIRPFVNLDKRMADLLRHLLQHGKAADNIRRILAAFNAYESLVKRDKNSNQSEQQPWARNQELDDPLSNRELEILSFLGRGLRNKDIAERLFISPGTVKKHTVNIYRKLKSHNRQHAVMKAYRLGILKQTT